MLKTIRYRNEIFYVVSERQEIVNRFNIRYTQDENLADYFTNKEYVVDYETENEMYRHCDDIWDSDGAILVIDNQGRLYRMNTLWDLTPMVWIRVY